jgi:L-lactate dehydrogenase (cytochrome)
MIISAASDYRAAAKRILPPFLFHYIDGGAYAEYTLRRNVEDLSEVALRQRVLKNMSDLSLETKLFNETLSMPVALAPVGLCGMYARRGEVQAAAAADAKGIPFTLSTVSVCPIEEVAPTLKRPMWFQLYVLRDRGFMRNALERAKAAGCSTLVFTVIPPALSIPPLYFFLLFLPSGVNLAVMQAELAGEAQNLYMAGLKAAEKMVLRSRDGHDCANVRRG